MSRSTIARLLLAGALLWGVAVAAGAALGAQRGARPLAAAPSSPASSPSPLAGPTPRSPPARVVGSTSFWYAESGTAARGAAGRLQRYRVAVEVTTDQDVAAFAAVVDDVFADARGWTAGRGFRFQRVPADVSAEFTIYLASAGTSQAMCATAGLQTGGFTSCRLAGKVIINVDRWLSAIPDYGAPLAEYRNYVINHEVGHQLGFGHEACPGAGRPAPVMQQQTYGLKGCVAYGWPYLDGNRYRGRSVR